ncbi:MAG: acyl-CoA dehydrogenase, partial [Bacteroidetes bacterium]|nr:acyl-CoA dehydrogenase [Bacteroidota bacterium]
DALINRIFEGTNEINRLLIVDMILKRAMKGELDLMGPAQKVAAELVGLPEMGEQDETLFGYEKKLVSNFKKSILLVAGGAIQKLAATLSKEQEILMNVADMIIETYVAESVMLRVEKLVKMKGENACGEQLAMMRVYINDACDKIWVSGKEALNSYGEGDELRMMLMGLKRYTKQEAFNPKAARQLVAEKLIRENKYCF